MQNDCTDYQNSYSLVNRDDRQTKGSEKMYRLNKNLAIYIPSRFDKAIFVCTRILRKKFGGNTNTNTKAIGTWVNEKGEVEKDNITIIRAWYAEKDCPKVVDSLINLAKEVKEDTKESVIVIEIDGEMLLI